MGIASFSPSLSVLRSGSPGMSMVLAPVQALVAFLMPIQSAQASHRSIAEVSTRPLACHQNIAQQTHIADHATSSVHPVSRLKVMREFEAGLARSQSGRMVISGRMSDVCAELDRIAQKETVQS